jgi:hypothetical protein
MFRKALGNVPFIEWYCTLGLPSGKGRTSSDGSKTGHLEKGGNLMNAFIHRDSDRLLAHAERIREGLQRLEKDCSVWARKREEKDLVELMEDLKGVETDVCLLLTDCTSACRPCREEAPKAVFHDLHEIFACLDTLFDGLKQARLQLGSAYIHDAVLDDLEIDYGRFSKLIGKLQRDLDEQLDQPTFLLEGTPAYLTEEQQAAR